MISDQRDLIAAGLEHDERMTQGWPSDVRSDSAVWFLVTKRPENAFGIAWLRNHARAILTGYATALDEVERLRDCMRTAGLQCFMRDGDPSEVAENMRSVAASWSATRAENARTKLDLAAIRAMAMLAPSSDSYQDRSEFERLKHSDVAQGKRIAELLAENESVTADRDELLRALASITNALCLPEGVELHKIIGRIQELM